MIKCFEESKPEVHWLHWIPTQQKSGMKCWTLAENTYIERRY